MAGQHTKMNWISIHKDGQNCCDIAETKPFIYDSNRDEWLWYKNLVVPTIQVLITSRSDQDLPLNTQVHLLCIKVQDDGVYSVVELQGSVQESIRNNKCNFAGIKFQETSYMQRNTHFFLVFLIIDIDSGDYLDIKCSPPILVEARKKSWLKRKNLASIFDPFLPDLLEKSYVQSVKEKKKEMTNLDNLDGLMSYFCNPYIRHKIMHPFFLLIKFPQSLSVYYNHNMVKYNGDKLEILLEQIQIQINNTLVNPDADDSDNSTNKVLIIFLNTNNETTQELEQSEKICNYFKVLKGPVLNFFKQIPYEIPSHFTQIKYSDELKNAYRMNYNKLYRLKFIGSNSQQYEIVRQSEETIRAEPFFKPTSKNDQKLEKEKEKLSKEKDVDKEKKHKHKSSVKSSETLKKDSSNSDKVESDETKVQLPIIKKVKLEENPQTQMQIKEAPVFNMDPYLITQQQQPLIVNPQMQDLDQEPQQLNFTKLFFPQQNTAVPFYYQQKVQTYDPIQQQMFYCSMPQQYYYQQPFIQQQQVNAYPYWMPQSYQMQPYQDYQFPQMNDKENNYQQLFQSM